MNARGMPGARPVPAAAGIGLRSPHHREVLERLPAVGWLEVHSENFLAAGGPALHLLDAVREHYPVSLHGVGLSLGSVDAPAPGHLRRLRALVERAGPGLVSEHLSWSRAGGVHTHDLLPLPYTREALDCVVRNVSRVQDFLGTRLLVENISAYLDFTCSTMPELEFLERVVHATGCGVLLDVNNIHVSAHNLGFDALDYLQRVPAAAVEEIHVAGHAVNRHPEGAMLIDDHGCRVSDEVWELYARALQRTGPVPTLVEWDTNLPSLDTLCAEAATAQRILGEHHARVA